MKPLIIALVVVAAAALGFRMMSGGGEYVEPKQNYMSVVTEPIEMMCKACKHRFQLDSSEFTSQMDSRGKGEMLKCPSCNEMQAWRFDPKIASANSIIQPPKRPDERSNSDEEEDADKPLPPARRSIGGGR